MQGKMKTRAIIICAGEATRWGNHLNTPKHLIEIEGERLLDRTVRLLNERGVEDVHVVVKAEDARYKVPGSKLYIAKLDYEKNADADKFLSSKKLWNKKGRTIVFYGDCYFTDEAMDTIIGHEPKDWVLFCRPGASRITGTKWGECFAQSFYPDQIAEHEAALYRIADLKKQGVIRRCGGWEHYRAMLGRGDQALNRHTMSDRYVEINDWTDDFDYPDDYETWIKRRSRVLLRQKSLR